MELRLIFSIAIPSGIISGILSPLVVSWLQHKFIWKRERDIDLKNSIFRDTARALSTLERDALDPGLQGSKASPGDVTRQTEFRPETLELCQTTRSLIGAFFSPEAFEAFDKAYKSQISINNIPDPMFDLRRTEALVKLNKEL